MEKILKALIILASTLILIIQPLVVKSVLPYFGSTINVWLVCFFFFQFFLFLGYLYSHFLIQKIYLKKVRFLHSFLGFISIYFLIKPILNKEWIYNSFGSMEIDIILSLLLYPGLPFFYLSTSTTLLQFYYEKKVQNGNAYRIYSISNLASCVGFIIYPLLMEPFFTIKTQKIIIFLFFIIYFLMLNILFFLFSVNQESRHYLKNLPILYKKIVFISFLININLFTILEQFNKNLPPVPLIVIIPMTGFFLSFSIAFSNMDFCRIKNYLIYAFSVINIITIILFGYKDVYDISFLIIFTSITISAFLTTLLLAFYLSFEKPIRGHSLFYLFITFGGLLGSFFYIFIIPKVFDTNIEFFLITSAVFLTVFLNEKKLFFKTFSFACILVTFYMSIVYNKNFLKDTISVKRDFFGINRVTREFSDDLEIRSYYSSKTLHGEQVYYQNQPILEPTAYYSRISGMGLFIEKIMNEKENLNVGIIGLGVGTMFSYSREYDKFIFFEINKNVTDIANKYFDFIKRGKGQLDIKIGDGRLKIKEYPDKYFDLIILDAFTGGLIPHHLLTKEAFELYFRKLKDSGYILVHVTNKYLKFKYLMKAIAKNLNKNLLLIYSDKNILYFEDFVSYSLVKHNQYDLEFDREIFRPSVWVIISQNPINLNLFDTINKKNIPAEQLPDFWTDDYSSILGLLK